MKRLIMGMAGIIVLVLAGCDLTGTEGGGNEDSLIIADGVIDENVTWESGKVYVVEDSVSVEGDGRLVIEPGVVVKFYPDAYLWVSDQAAVIAEGTQDAPIVFTSIRDDAHGGDSNGDGDLTRPARGDWDQVYIEASGSRFVYCEFLYGGGGSYDSTLEVYGSYVTVDHCTFAHNEGQDYGAFDAAEALSQTIITNNVFYDSEKPLLVGLRYSLDDSNTFHDPDNPAVTNDYNGIFVDSYALAIGEDGPSITWEETEVAYVLDSTLTVSTGYTLTLGDDVVLKLWGTDTGIYLETSEDQIVNHDGSGVAFTSYRDDMRKGDTNGDGTTTSPSDGDWEGIYVDATSSWASWSNIYYALY
ncbi:hypothetical protein [Spirochaeta thermophila]|uniref:Right handed beta helix domain-containing protein n=1 Tax=Winmispira thermophila (strain ATCC 49972 / DSM 6192 / RI 19.B1) TaxID=665571 RepID=E0RQD6_WINT6|nr:hypothetical protein [Spirochaeta thermophila]ADN02912.1 hypothetical protein STHERM_c19770 [Spirochaeta thermophila DSM 6192]